MDNALTHQAAGAAASISYVDANSQILIVVVAVVFAVFLGTAAIITVLRRRTFG